LWSATAQESIVDVGLGYSSGVYAGVSPLKKHDGEYFLIQSLVFWKGESSTHDSQEKPRTNIPFFYHETSTLEGRRGTSFLVIAT